jgi:hypothetical protein
MASKKGSTSQSGEPGARGWVKRGVQVPADLERLLKVAASSEKHGSVQAIVSVGIALVLGMPPELRDRMLRWAYLMANRDPNLITDADAWKVFEAAQKMHDDDVEEPADITTDWYIREVLGVEPEPPKQDGPTKKAG